MSKEIKTTDHPFKFSKKSLIYLGAALIVIITGFALLIAGDISFAPILLVAGYVVLIPVAILKK